MDDSLTQGLPYKPAPEGPHVFEIQTPLPPGCESLSDPVDPPDLADPRGPLADAAKIVYGQRRDSYGAPEDNHTRTAQLWSTYLGFPVTARQVCMMMILLKISRDKHSETLDNLTDIAGYAENAWLVTPTPV